MTSLLLDRRGPRSKDDDDNDAATAARLPMLITYKAFFSTVGIFDMPNARFARLWLFGVGISEGIFALLCLGIAIALGIPAWPPAGTGSVSYGYTLNVLNWFVWGLCVATAVWCNAVLTHVTTAFTTAQLVVNFVVFVVQLVKALTGIINLNVSANFFAFVTSLILTVTSFAVCTASAYLSYLLYLFQRPVATYIGSAVRR